jgi:VWFA-related protein
VPVTIGLVVDGSGSMRPKRSYVIAAAMAFAQASNREDELFTLNFNDDVSYGLAPGQGFTNDLAQLRTALLGLECEGRTALYDAVAEALQHVKTGKFDRKALLVVSDGEDTHSSMDFEDVLQMARESGATIYTISAYDPASARHNTRILKKLSKVSGGQFYFPTTTPEIVSVCRQIAKDIRNRYTIAYTPTNLVRDGAYRRILVKAVARNGQKLAVRAREGYYAPASGKAVAITTDDR